MAEATRLLDDDQLPIDIHDATRARLTTLRAELQMYGDVSHDAVIITRSAAYLMSVIAGTIAADPGDDNPLAPEVATVATGAMDLGSDTTAERGGRAIADALDDLDALAPEPEPDTSDSTDSASAALTRGSRRWLEHDLWDTHVNRVVAGSITAARRAGTAGLAGIAAISESERISAVFRAGRALLKARYPGIFP
jgi:hypothetical protein